MALGSFGLSRPRQARSEGVLPSYRHPAAPEPLMLLSAISSSLSSGHTVLDEVTCKRNRARVQGRKLYGKIIGTTLLTKGLEADTVILVKPSELFKDKDGLKHLYVALTRAVKEIVLIDY